MTMLAEASASLKSYIERIEAVATERREMGDEIRAIFAEAKAAGFDVKAIRTIVKRRDKDPTELADEETILENYMHAIGMLTENPLHQAVAVMAVDTMAREQVIDALLQLVPVNGEIIAKVGGKPVRLWRSEDGQANVALYVEPTAAPTEKVGKALKKPAAVLSIVPKGRGPSAAEIKRAADASEQRAGGITEDESLDDDESEPVE